MDPTKEVIRELKCLDAETDDIILRREEMFWAQRSRQNWLKDGDKSTSLFHTKANQQPRHNTIKGVFDNGGS